MAGKSTYMRQVALIVLMAQIGSFVPADSANIGVVDRIFTRVGASDDLASGQSTFMVEMMEVANILKEATANSLVVLDEIGRGTSTYDGLSIAWAVAEYIENKEKCGAKTLFATHYHELTDLENEIKDGNKILGLSEVTGNGLIITINDNQDISLNSWFADPNLLVVHDADLISVVNELKNAGAEAISINEQRLVTTSAIECDGNIIKVNGEKIGAPFTIKAIGLPEVLINVDRFGGYLDNLRETRYLKVSIEKATDKKTITIPKYTGILKFQYAVSK